LPVTAKIATASTGAAGGTGGSPTPRTRAEFSSPRTTIKSPVRNVWNRMLDHRLRRHHEVSFMEQFVGSAYMTEESRAYTAKLGEGLLQIVAEGQAQEILKTIPVPFLASFFIGSVRETARLIRSGSIPDGEESRAVAFQLCWDGVRA
jgi:hypothetical protein